MRFTFHPRRNGDAATPGQASDHVTKNPVVSDVPEAQEPDQNAYLYNQEALDDAEEAQLLIDDPKSFEKVQIQRHIERERTLNEKAQA